MLKLVFWAVAVVVGAYLGYTIGLNMDETGIAFFNVIVASFLAVAIVVVLAVFALLRRGHPAAQAATVAGILLVVSVAIGWAATLVLRLGAP